MADVARRGLAGPGAPLPHLAQLQVAFGSEHDLTRVTARVGGAAAEACGDMGASAYAHGENIAFARSPSLEEAAHEAAHVIQQRQGRVTNSDRSHGGRSLEAEADAIANAVQRGERVSSRLGLPAQASIEPRAVQRRLLATESTPGAIDRFRALAEPASGTRLGWNPTSHEIVDVATLPVPATSVSFQSRLTNIMTDTAQDAEVNFGEHQGGALGVLVGLYPDPPDLTGSRVQLIDMDDIEAIESGAPGNGVALLMHELEENYIAHGYLPAIPGADNFPTAHAVGGEAESDVAEDLVGPGRRIAEAIEVRSLTDYTNVQDFENYYLVYDSIARPSSPADTEVRRAHRAARVRIAFLDLDNYVTADDAPPSGGLGPLSGIATALASNPTATARISGFTDNVGSATFNQGLSERRANNVKALLVAAVGSALGPTGPSRLFSEGLGASRFVTSNATDAGRAANRRVEIVVERPAP